jgi:hypothetical protein
MFEVIMGATEEAAALARRMRAHIAAEGLG